MGWLLLVAVIVVYIILGILYESFVHPLTILSGLPSAALGALLTLYLTGVPLTIYAFVGMIMLVGIVKKNAIMMIDFALARQRGRDAVAAAEAIYDPAHHDDNNGGADGHSAHRAWIGHGRGLAPPARAMRRWWTVVFPTVDALHHAGSLYISGQSTEEVRYVPPNSRGRWGVSRVVMTW
jgi:hypothetical protein